MNRLIARVVGERASTTPLSLISTTSPRREYTAGAADTGKKREVSIDRHLLETDSSPGESFGLGPSLVIAMGVIVLAVAGSRSVVAQEVRFGNPVTQELRRIYDRGLSYIVKQQNEDGSWRNDMGVTGICLMALIASGEDPNFGRYAEPVRKAIRAIIKAQNTRTGFIRTGMYQHGFAMLALADCYGAVDDDLLWPKLRGKANKRSIGRALELAVRCAVTSQKRNRSKGWRYQPTATNADTSVSGAVLMGLLGARNAGIEVPDKSIDQALNYFAKMTLKSGNVNYSGMGGLGSSQARSSIATLVAAVAKRKDLDFYKAAAAYIRDNSDGVGGSWPCYFRYYCPQALFQSDYAAWRRWAKDNVRLLADIQQDDGSFAMRGSHGPAYATGMLLLSAALEYCFLPVYER